LVLPYDKWGEGKEKKNKIKSFEENWLWTERKWSKVSDDTGIGDPRLATRDKGEHFFKDVTEKIGNILVEICETNIENIYTYEPGTTGKII
jgi:creatinine amidohydrolase